MLGHRLLWTATKIRWDEQGCCHTLLCIARLADFLRRWELLYCAKPQSHKNLVGALALPTRKFLRTRNFFFLHFWHFFCTFGLYMSQKQFTHSVRKVFAREILPTGKFWIFVSLPGTLVKAMLMLGCYVDRSASRPHVFARAHFLLQPTTPFCVHPTHNLATHQIVHC